MVLFFYTIGRFIDSILDRTSRTCPTYSINNRRQESLSADVRSSKDVDILSIHDDKESTEGSSV